MTQKLWFQWGVAVIIGLLAIKFFIEIHWIFNPIIIIFNTILIPLLLGGVLYYISEPLQRFMEKKGAPRWSTILTIIIVLLGLVAGFLLLIGDPISKQVDNLVENAPSLAKELQNDADYVLDNRENLPPQVEDFVNSITDSIQDITVTASKYLVSFVSGAVSATFTLILVPFFFIFMLKDHEKFAPNIYNLFEGHRREWVKDTLEKIDHVLRSYVQGQVLISLILATMIFIGYQIIGLEYALLLTIFAFFMNMIPFIGPWVSLVPAVVVAVIQDPILVLWVCVVTVIAQQIESNLVTPNIMGKSLDIAGFIGIIIAIPTYAVIKVIVINIYNERKNIRKTATKTVDD